MRKSIDLLIMPGWKVRQLRAKGQETDKILRTYIEINARTRQSTNRFVPVLVIQSLQSKMFVGATVTILRAVIKFFSISKGIGVQKAFCSYEI